MSESDAPGRPRPLCVDLDGTLIATDILWESVLLLVKRRPWKLFALPFWLAGGRANLKRRVCEHARPSPEALPYRSAVLSFIEDARRDGRSIHLVTASDQQIADRIAAHLGVFDEVVGSDGQRNLKASVKRAYLDEKFGPGGFDYLGDSAADLGIWKLSGRALTVNGSTSTIRRAKTSGEVREVYTRPRLGLRPWVKALRPHQWAKNVLLFVPAVLAHRYTDIPLMLQVLLAFFAFSFCASSVYVANDLLDLEADRQHRTKRKRPFAAGVLSIPAGILLGAGALAVGVGIALLALPTEFLLVLIGYLVLTSVYTVYLKQKLLVDVITLALLFTYRVLAGGVAASVEVSFWLLAFSLFFFTGLAFVKRYSELAALPEKNLDRVPGRNYGVSDLEVVKSFGPSCGVAAVLVMCLYIHSPEVTELYQREQILYLIAPVLLYWVGRIWFLAGRNQLDDDPVVFAIRDRISLLAGAVVAGIVVVARFGW